MKAAPNRGLLSALDSIPKFKRFMIIRYFYTIPNGSCTD